MFQSELVGNITCFACQDEGLIRDFPLRWPKPREATGVGVGALASQGAVIGGIFVALGWRSLGGYWCGA
jgi:hypothetical protein